MRTFILSLVMLSSIFCPCRAQGKTDRTTVPSLDLGRYMGTWYEIARFDHGFERGMSYATAEYSMPGDGKVKVVNSGIRDGEIKSSVGKAKMTETPGLLRVSFFGPFYSDYRVLMLAEDYSYALVGSKSPNYLWILSRTPVLPYDTVDAILDEARSRGYQTDRLLWIQQ